MNQASKLLLLFVASPAFSPGIARAIGPGWGLNGDVLGVTSPNARVYSDHGLIQAGLSKSVLSGKNMAISPRARKALLAGANVVVATASASMVSSAMARTALEVGGMEP